MTQPLALVLYERLLPGTQLVNRLQDLGYRVQVVHAPDTLVSVAEQEKPLLAFADLQSAKGNVVDAIKQLKQHAATAHLPVVAFADEDYAAAQAAAQSAGALVTDAAAVLQHLQQLIDRALSLD
jgi:CheY-like chemotaxis protein